jgi:hypothetical protein
MSTTKKAYLSFRAALFWQPCRADHISDAGLQFRMDMSGAGQMGRLLTRRGDPEVRRVSNEVVRHGGAVSKHSKKGLHLAGIASTASHSHSSRILCCYCIFLELFFVQVLEGSAEHTTLLEAQTRCASEGACRSDIYNANVRPVLMDAALRGDVREVTTLIRTCYVSVELASVVWHAAVSATLYEVRTMHVCMCVRVCVSVLCVCMRVCVQ